MIENSNYYGIFPFPFMDALGNFSRSSKKNLVDKVIKWPWHVCEITKSILTFIAQKRYTFKLTLNDMFSFQ